MTQVPPPRGFSVNPRLDNFNAPIPCSCHWTITSRKPPLSQSLVPPERAGLSHPAEGSELRQVDASESQLSPVSTSRVSVKALGLLVFNVH